MIFQSFERLNLCGLEMLKDALADKLGYGENSHLA
jgi:hypothetical protein